MDGKLKNYLEIIALLVGGLFIFFTRGLDQIKGREPSWLVLIDAVGGDRLE